MYPFDIMLSGDFIFKNKGFSETLSISWQQAAQVPMVFEGRRSRGATTLVCQEEGEAVVTS